MAREPCGVDDLVRQAVILAAAGVAEHVKSRRAHQMNLPRKRRRLYFRDPSRMATNRIWDQMYAWRENDAKWQMNCGMKYATFLYTLETLKPFLCKQPRSTTSAQHCAPAGVKLLVVLVLLHEGSQQHSMERQCGISQPTVSAWVNDVLSALDAVSSRYIYLPDTREELVDIARGFEQYGNSRVPMCVGAIDGTHVPVRSTDISYKNCKGYKSINMQCVCDDQLLIRDVFGGYSGNFCDKTVFSLWEEEVGFVKWLKTVRGSHIKGVDVGFFLAGDGGYTLNPGLLIPFRSGEGNLENLSPAQRDWNYWHSSMRMCIEQTFGLLKGRWGILASTARLQYAPAKVQKIFKACCVLHNICILQSDWLPRRDWVDHSPGNLYDASPVSFCNIVNEESDLAKAQRLALLLYLQEAHSPE